jgi:hypothetical protein
VPRATAQVNVTQEHNNPSRDGVYIDPAFTLSAAANLTRNLNFNGTISGKVYAQPLYIESGPSGPRPWVKIAMRTWLTVMTWAASMLPRRLLQLQAGSLCSPEFRKAGYNLLGQHRNIWIDAIGPVRPVAA